MGYVLSSLLQQIKFLEDKNFIIFLLLFGLLLCPIEQNRAHGTNEG